MTTDNPEDTRRTIRIISVVAATFISLSCGTNYTYSAWSPQFAEKLGLTATEVNLIGNAGNFGMYAMGIPGGILNDWKGPRYGVFVGSCAMTCGYFPLRWAYVHGPGSMSVAAMCFFSLLTGMASCTAFNAAMKVCVTNWPRHRGTATALPLSSYGLSALFWTIVAGLALPHDTAGYLLILACGTSVMIFVGMFFLQIVGQGPSYQALAGSEAGFRTRKDSNPLRHTAASRNVDDEADFEGINETSSLVSSESVGPGDISASEDPQRQSSDASSKLHITGLQLLRVPKFWQLFIMLSFLSGVGLMTINNIGNDTRALWHHYDDSASRKFIQQRQLAHVSIISTFSFLGRLLSGIGSDWLVHHNASRLWTLVVAATLFSIAQVVAIALSDPRHLYWLSSLTGLAYGGLYGVFPALVADAFGPSGMGINWAVITIAPIITGNIFNLIYGRILDSHSHFEEPGRSGGGGGERVCDDGRACYADAYWVTLTSSVLGVGWSLWCIQRERLTKSLHSRGH